MKDDPASTNEAPVEPAVAGQEIRPQAPVAPAAPTPVQEPQPAPAPAPIAAAPKEPVEPESDLDLATLTAPSAEPEAAIVPAETLPGAPPEAGGPSAEAVYHRPVVIRRHRPGRAVYISIVMTFLVAGAAGCYGLLQHYDARLSAVRKANDELTGQAQQLEQQAVRQLELNQGKSPDAKADDLKSAEISLLGGKVTATMPAGWAKAKAGGCTGGSRNSTAVCQAVLAVAPQDQLQADGTAKWDVDVAVYDYAEADGDARKWYESKYDGTPLTSRTNPKATAISTEAVGGNSALQYQLISGAATKPGYVEAYHVVVHGAYAVVIKTRLQQAAGTGTPGYDYRTTTTTALQELFKSVTFKD